MNWFRLLQKLSSQGLDFKALNQLWLLAKQDPQQALDAVAQVTLDVQTREELLKELKMRPEMVQKALLSLGLDQGQVEAFSRQALDLLNKKDQ